MAKKRKEKVEEAQANRLKPIVPAAKEVVGVNTPDLSSPKGIDDRRYRERGTVEAITPVTPFKATAAPKGVYSTESVNPTPVVNNKVEAQNPVSIKNPAIEAAKEATKPKTLSDLLAEQRQTAIKEKTDAAKMQKYYALTDALGALGKMGATAIGGAIGGGMADSAPIVEGYQSNRGYVNAFERARKANDRLRALDDVEYNLALRDEERSYRQQEAKLDREYKKQLADYEHQLRLAQAQHNADLELAIKTKIENLNHDHRMAQEKLKGNYAIAEKNLSKEIVEIQNRGAGNSQYKDFKPYTLHDGTVVNIPKDLFSEMKSFYASKGQIGDDYVDEDNIDAVLRKHPNLVNDFLLMYGMGATPTGQTTTANVDYVSKDEDASQAAPNAEKEEPEQVTAIPSVSIMNETPNTARKFDERNKRISDKQAVKNSRVSELMEDGYTEKEAKRKVRVNNRIAKKSAKYGFTPYDTTSENVLGGEVYDVSSITENNNKKEYSVENDPFADLLAK